MMKSDVPWSIRGIDDEIREAARAAARRSGLSVSEWLNDLIAREARVRTASGHRHEAEADGSGLARAIRRLTQRIRAMDADVRASVPRLSARLDDLEDRLSAASTGGSGASLAAVARTIESLSAEIDEAERDAAFTAHNRNAREEVDLGPVAEAIHALDRRFSTAVRAEPEDNSGDIHAIRSRLDALLAGGSERETAGRAATLDATLRSLERNLAEVRSRFDEPAKGPDRFAESDDELIAAIAEIAARQRLIDAEAHPEKPASAEPFRADLQDEMARLRDEIARIGPTGAPDHDSHAALLERINRLAEEWPFGRRLLSSMQADIEVVRNTIEIGGLERLASSLEEVMRRLPDRERLDDMAGEIAAIRRALDEADGPRAMSRLEMRVAELARGVEAALNAANAVSRRSDPDAIGRLEQRFESVSSRIDEFLARTTPPETALVLEDRLERLIERVDSLHDLRLQPSDGFAAMQAEIAALRREIAERPVPRTDHLERQVAELAAGLDAAIHARPGREEVSELEAQVAHLAAELERSLPRGGAVRQIEENLGRLQAHLATNRDSSVEAARSAAREAVRELVGMQGDSELVRALKADLDNIRAAAGVADQRTQATLGTIHDTLARVVDRLTRLEREAAEAHAEPARATGTYGAPSLHAATPQPEDYRPLEPGSGRPGIHALREPSRGVPESTRDRRADFIAAARRAAQAAQAEVSAAPEAEPEPERDGSGAFSRIGQAIRGRRRPLLLAAAALILAISAVQIFDGGRRVTSVREVATETAAPPAITPAPKPEAALRLVTPAISAMGEEGLTAPPSEPPDSITFARPEPVDARFGSRPDAPPPKSFTPRPLTVTPAARSSAVAPVSFHATEQVETAKNWQALNEAAIAGDAIAAFELGARYAEGHGVPRDLAVAERWYERAAEAGITVAQYRLGSLYERGQGVKRDPAIAAGWYRRAAEQGHVGAMHNLAVLMSGGIDGNPDVAEAVKWFTAAAGYGVKDSQFNLGVIYARGMGVPRDMPAAYKWFALAASAGDRDAAARRDETAKALSPDELALARASVQAWRAIPMVAEANTIPVMKDSESAGADDGPSLVKRIQAFLTEQGYDPGPADGVEGPKTRDAVRAFQRMAGLDETGAITRDVIAAASLP